MMTLSAISMESGATGLLGRLDTIVAFVAVMLLLSLLVMVLVQLVVFAFSLRGRNLEWGVMRLLAQVLPGIGKPHLRGIARAIVTHPVVAARGRATAMRADEAVRLLEDLAFPPDCAAEIDDARRATLSAKLVGRYLVTAEGDAESARRELETAKQAHSVARDGAFPLRVEAERLSAEMKLAAQRLGVADEQGGEAGSTASVVAASRALAQTSSALDDADAHLKVADALEKRRSGEVKTASARFEAAERAAAQAMEAVEAHERDAQVALGRAAVAAEEAAVRTGAPLLNREMRVDLIRSLATRAGHVDEERPAVPEIPLADAVRGWFDTVMDRTTERFAFHARAIGAVVALLVAAALHVDALEVVRRLAADGTRPPGVGALSFIRLGWNRDAWQDLSLELPGIAMSALFLAFGAAMAFNLFRRLATLRPALASKVDAGRETR